MSGHLRDMTAEDKLVDSMGLASAISCADFSGCAATVVGYGNTGRQYVKALRALGVKQIRVCSRSDAPLAELRDIDGITTLAGGFLRIEGELIPGELGIVATPTLNLVASAEHLVACGYRKILIEKPVSLRADEIQRLADKLEKQGVDAACAYNRVAYPSFQEVRARTRQEGGITSCTYTFTEWFKPDWLDRFPPEELARWGISNSLHVMSMAHGLIGMPRIWSSHRAGSQAWHPTGAIFVGSGISEQGIPFAYHADWFSTGRWSVEVHTAISSYRLCPLEKAFRRTTALADWEEIPIATFAPGVKAGFVEQVAAMFCQDIRRRVPLISLQEAAALAGYGEEVFGYRIESRPVPKPRCDAQNMA